MIKGLLVLALCCLLHASTSEQVGELAPDGRLSGENHAHNVYNVMRESAELLNKIDDSSQRLQDEEHSQHVRDSQTSYIQPEHNPAASRDESLRSRVHGTSFLERESEMIEAQTENLAELDLDDQLNRNEEELPSFLKKAANSVGNAAKAVGNAVAKGGVRVGATIKISAPGVISHLKATGSAAARVGARAASAVRARAPGVLRAVSNSARRLGAAAGKAARAAAPYLKKGAQEAFKAAKQFGSGLGNGLTSAYTAGLNGKRALGSLPPGRNGFTGAGGRLKDEDNECVMCQYFVQRIKGFVVENSAPLAFVEESTKMTVRTRSTGKWAVPHFTDDLSKEQKREEEFEAAKAKPGYAEAETVPNIDEAMKAAAEDVRSTDYPAVKPPELVPESHPRHPKHRKAARERDLALLAKRQEVMTHGFVQGDEQEQRVYDGSHVEYLDELPSSKSQSDEEPVAVATTSAPAASEEHNTFVSSSSKSGEEPNLFEPEYTDSLEVDKHAALLEQHALAFALAHEQGNTDQLASGPVEPAPAAVMLEQAARASAKASEKAEFIAHRFRDTDMRDYRSGDKRFDITRVPAPNAATQQQRYQFEVMSAMVYQSFVRFCTGRMPEPYFSQCGKLVGSYRTIAEGIHYGDRPDEICVRMEICKIDSYIQSSPHALYREDITSGKRADLYSATNKK